MNRWITGIFAASLLGSMAMALCPAGRVRPVLRMVCGIICALAVVRPLAEVDLDSLAAEMAAYGQRARILAEEAEEEGKMLERRYIEEQCAAYILDKGQELHAQAQEAEVLAVWDDRALVWVPWEATVRGPYHAGLAAVIEGELGIPAERQAWSGDE